MFLQGKPQKIPTLQIGDGKELKSFSLMFKLKSLDFKNFIIGFIFRK